MTDTSKFIAGLLVRLERSKEGLKELTASTEEDFLSIADRLLDFHNRADEMSGIASSAADILSGREISKAIDELRNLLDQSCNCLDESCEVFNQIEGMLLHITAMLNQIGVTIHNMGKMTKNLKIFSINIKILSAGLDARGEVFRVLADDVKKLAQSVDERSNTILLNSNSLMKNLRQAHSNVETIKARQNELKRTVSENAAGTLLSLKEKHDVALDTTRQISLLSNSIFRDIDGILVALQFHDITRQQIEHVVEAINEIRQRIEEVPPTEARLNLVGPARSACVIQADQLRHSRDELVTAVEGIIGNLRDILKNVSGMVVQTGRLVGTETDKDSSFLIEIRSSVNAVTSSLLNSLAECSSMDKGLSSMVETATGTVNDVNSFVGDTEQIGTEIELLSLNARIKSAHIEEEGVGLGVIAESIQKMSDDIHHKIVTVSETIGGLVNTTRDFGAEINTAAAKRGSESEGVAGELKMLNDSLSKMNMDTSSLLDRLIILAGGLAKDIESVISNTNVHRVAALSIEKVIAELDYISDSFERLNSLKGVADSDLHKSIESRYTMKTEREIHRLHSLEESKAADELHNAPEKKEGDVKYF